MLYPRLHLRCLFLLAFAIPVCLPAYSADRGIGVTLVNYTLQHTANNEVTAGYTLSISARVKNFDTLPFSGILDFGLRNSHFDLTNQSIFGRPNYSGQQIQLDGGEEVPAIFSITIDPTFFIAPGPDVVVVWPISPEPVEDSILIHLTLLDTLTGMSDEQPGNHIAYTTLKDRIQLFNIGDQQMNFKQVRIFDLMGRQISNTALLINNEIPIPDLPRGIYLCELITLEGKSSIIKFVK
ncbi:MAG: T9SS type A sorting domain-containing protein [Bacteroidetes bacterium]|nr:T9SS type A sorting domain-containing protein [Bacteroidota bacterium]